jgi:hypothetical protein
MWKITKAAEFPVLSMRLKTANDLSHLKASDLSPDVNFAGKDGKIVVDDIKATVQGKTIEIEAHGHFSLKEFSVEAPSLLGIAVSDTIRITSKTVWEQP